MGKTEGNGGANDFTRAFAASRVKSCLAGHNPIDGERNTAIIISGGTEGVITPHLLVFAIAEPPGAALEARADAQPDPDEARLSFGIARTEPVLPEQIGTLAQVEATRKAVLKACEDARVNPKGGIALAQVKCPLLTSAKLQDATLRGETVRTSDAHVSMGLTRAASALGVALATGEVTSVVEADIGSHEAMADKFSAVASISAGAEADYAEVFVIGNAPGSWSTLRAAHTVMQDPLDSRAIVQLLETEGLDTRDGQLCPTAHERLICVLAKADTPRLVRERRTTMCDDADFQATRHARASLGGVLGSVLGDPRLFISGGAEHQGPPGGGPVCVIYSSLLGEAYWSHVREGYFP